MRTIEAEWCNNYLNINLSLLTTCQSESVTHHIDSNHGRSVREAEEVRWVSMWVRCW